MLKERREPSNKEWGKERKKKKFLSFFSYLSLFFLSPIHSQSRDYSQVYHTCLLQSPYLFITYTAPIYFLRISYILWHIPRLFIFHIYHTYLLPVYAHQTKRFTPFLLSFIQSQLSTVLSNTNVGQEAKMATWRGYTMHLSLSSRSPNLILCNYHWHACSSDCICCSKTNPNNQQSTAERFAKQRHAKAIRWRGRPSSQRSEFTS